MVNKLRRHKVMEKVIKKLMANNLPPSFKFKDTYDSIELPSGYALPPQQDIVIEFNAMLLEEEAMPTVTMDIEDLDIISTNVYSNTTTGRIGIGTANPAGTLHVHSTDSIVVPSGTTAQRSQTPVNGMLRYNTETGYFETYTVSGWGSLATPPSIESFTPTAVNTGGFSTITVSGSFFDQNSSIKLRGSDGTEYSTTNFSFTSTTSISATLPLLPSAKSPYTVVVTAGSGLSTESTDTLTSTNNIPVWSSPAAGSNVYVNRDTSTAITLSATDADGDTLTYSIVSGTLPGGITLSGNQISGTSTDSAGSTSTITVRASDGDLYADRTFTIETTLYAFTSHTFTNAGATGRIGPTLTQLRNTYNVTWDTNTSLFNVVTQGYQEWTVPVTGTYEIEVAGASGGYKTGGTYTTYPGRGIIITGNVNLSQGDVIKIMVGQKGIVDGEGGGGGGGSLVYDVTNSRLLMIAGGGGGNSSRSVSSIGNGKDASSTESGTGYGFGCSSNGTGTGGTGGSGGGNGCAAGGGGWLGSGSDGTHSGEGGSSLGGTAVGGTSTNTGGTPHGGFGGGGAGSPNFGYGGGGGGYSGGGGGGFVSANPVQTYGGGGGGTYYNAVYVSSYTNTNYTAYGDDGYAKITLL